MALTEFEFINGLTCLSIVIVFAIVSMIIVSKYFKTKERVYLLFGIAWFGIVEVWIPASIVLLMILITGSNLLSLELFVIIGISGYPITLLMWLTVVSDFLWKEKQKIILLIFFIIGVVIEFLFLYLVFTEPSLIGNFYGTVDFDYGLFISVYFVCLLGIFLTTGFLFARLSLKSDDPEIKLRGKFLTIAFVTFIIGAFIDNIPTFNVPILILGRLIIILAGIIFYLAFILPNWLKKLFLK